MRTTVDIPDDLYRAVKVMAAERGSTVRELVLEGLEAVMRTRKAGRSGTECQETPSARSGSPEVNHETDYDVIGFP
jgi:hypothetical protein